MFIASYKQIVPRGRRIASQLIAMAIAMSFLAMLLPIASAWANDSNTMPCCVGKTAGHCESGIATKKLPPSDTEPMCGLDNAQTADDEITIVAEPSHTDSHHAFKVSPSQPAVESLSVRQPCQMECGACAATSSRQQKRDDSAAEFITRLLSPSATASQFKRVSLTFSSNEDWEQTGPRGPPVSVL